jgi:hypothetical protein
LPVCAERFDEALMLGDWVVSGSWFIEYKASVHEHCDPSKLVARRIDTGRAESSGWTIFRIAA